MTEVSAQVREATGMEATNRRAIRTAMLLAALAGGTVCLGFVIGQPSAAARITCDRTIKTILTSKDRREIYRDAVLIRALNCDVSRRIGPDRRFRPAAETR